MKTTRQKAIAIGTMIFSVLCPVGCSLAFKHSGTIWNPVLQFFRVKVVTLVSHYLAHSRVSGVSAGRAAGNAATAGANGVPGPPRQQTIFGVVPHGIIPFSVGLTNFGELNRRVFDSLRIVTATATKVRGRVIYGDVMYSTAEWNIVLLLSTI